MQKRSLSKHHSILSWY